MWVDIFKDNGMAECISSTLQGDEDVAQIIDKVGSRQQEKIDQHFEWCYKAISRKRSGLHCRARRKHVREFKEVMSSEEVFWLALESKKRKQRIGSGWSEEKLEYFSRASGEWFPVVDLRVREDRKRTDVDFIQSWGVAVRDNTEEVLRKRFDIPDSLQPSWNAEFTNTGRVRGTCESDWDHQPRLRPIGWFEAESTIEFVSAKSPEPKSPSTPVVLSEEATERTSPPLSEVDEEKHQVHRFRRLSRESSLSTEVESPLRSHTSRSGTKVSPIGKHAFSRIEDEVPTEDFKRVFRGGWLASWDCG